ncbi:MAG TPA: CDP-alcohol phosphatidyltransferase family protein [Methylomirabilota bacterium]|nr:CDP-alcohol phosphatidyltransferase family protein [Methylomirabilota bacterium]
MRSSGPALDRAPWDQQLARRLVRPLASTPLTPNHVTTLSLLLAVAAGVLFASGGAAAQVWAATLFILGRFVDHADGELARLTGRSSPLGHYYDYAVGALSSLALFLGLGIGLREGALGGWTLPVGLAASAFAVGAMLLGLGTETRQGSPTVVYPARWRLELEDGIYLLPLVVWLGWLTPVFLLMALGQTLFCGWVLSKFLRAGRSAARRPSSWPAARRARGRRRGPRSTGG